MIWPHKMEIPTTLIHSVPEKRLRKRETYSKSYVLCVCFSTPSCLLFRFIFLINEIYCISLHTARECMEGKKKSSLSSLFHSMLETQQCVYEKKNTAKRETNIYWKFIDFKERNPSLGYCLRVLNGYISAVEVKKETTFWKERGGLIKTLLRRKSYTE